MPLLQSINNQSINESVGQSINQSTSQSVSQSVSQSINQSVSQSVSQSVNQLFVESDMLYDSVYWWASGSFLLWTINVSFGLKTSCCFFVHVFSFNIDGRQFLLLVTYAKEHARISCCTLNINPIDIFMSVLAMLYWLIFIIAMHTGDEDGGPNKQPRQRKGPRKKSSNITNNRPFS